MIEFPLELRGTEETGGCPDGWLLVGGDVAEWVRWLNAWMGQRADELSMLPLPRSSEDRTPVGLFVPASLPESVRQPDRAVPYRLLGGRLFVPSDAQLRYPLMDEELAGLFLRDVNVLHPRLGLVCGDENELIRIADLLSLEQAPSQRWNRAHAGLTSLPTQLRFGAVIPAVEPEELLQQSQEDIGTEEPTDIEPAPDEKQPGIFSRGAQSIRNAFHNAILAFTSRMPNTAHQRTWVNRLEDWANQRLSDLAERREREINRLVNLLCNDPDKGLKHAFPVGSDNSYRGVSEPGSTLPANEIDFNLRDLGGGGASDPWSLAWEQMQALSELYRRAAERELALRRFRRAAYIYAKLLNDYESAAQALRQGGYYREAATLYRKRLSADKTAAECLRAGGLYEEAAAIYEELGEFEQVGDMYRELDREEEAVEAYEQAVRRKLSKFQTVSASRIVDQKLHDAPRARQMLWESWPTGTNASECLEEYFHLLERDAEGETAIHSLRRLSNRVDSLQQRMELGRLFTKVHDRFPNDDVREESADQARVMLGTYLRENGPKIEEATEALQSLDRADRLLERDARTFTQARLNQRPEPARPALPATNQPLRLELSQRESVDGFRIHQAVQSNWGALVLGVQNARPTVRLLGASTFAQWEPVPEWQVHDAVLAPAMSRSGPSLLHVCSNAELEARSLRFGQEELRIVTRAYVSTAMDSVGRRYQCHPGLEESCLRRFTYDQLDWTQDFNHPSGIFDAADRRSFHPLGATGRAVYVAAGNNLMRFQGNGQGRVEIPARALSMVQSSGQTSGRLMFHMEFGAGLFRDEDNRWDKVRYFASDMAEPRVDFLRTGHLLAANTDLIRVYVVGKYEISRVAEIQGPNARVIGVLPGPGINSFRVVTENDVFTYDMKSV